MTYLEIRRHTMRNKPGQHLSQAGVDLARSVGDTIGSFNYVVTSTLPRAYETAIAMGFAVDEQSDFIAMMTDEVAAEVDWTLGFAEFQRAIALNGATTRFAQALGEYLHSVVERLPDNSRILVISHGGIVEAATLGCLPQQDVSDDLGTALDYCEGVGLSYEDGAFKALVRFLVLGQN